MADLNGDENPTAHPLVWIGLIVAAAISFWGQAVITEERFVPSLNVIASRFGIPDDVAGATLMAAGASSPELFTSIVALFITHSALGFGTIVGSEIFNQLAISAGSILASRNAKLYLSRAVFLREVLFYGLALVFLLVALADRRVVQDEQGNDETSIVISWDKGVLLLAGYAAYVLVCANFDRVLSIFYSLLGHKEKEEAVDKTPLPSAGIEVEDRSSRIGPLPFLRQVRREPSTNFHKTSHPEAATEMFRCRSDTSGRSEASTNMNDNVSPPSLVSWSFDSNHSGHIRKRFYDFLVAPSQPDQTDIHGLEDIDRHMENDTISCFLWQQSSFHSKSRVDIHAWHLRWFTLHRDGITSVADRGYRPKQYRYPEFQRIEVDEAHLAFRLVSEKRGYTFLAPTLDILHAVLDTCDNMERRTDTTVASARTDMELEADVEAGPSLIEFPHGASRLAKALHICLFPLKFLIHYTIPDSRRDVADRAGRRAQDASMAIVTCVIWIVGLSYTMVTSLEYLGSLLRIPSTLIGVTVSAVGTSLPNYVASQVAARQGFGNMAVSNAFGSNTFNIFVGLGIPWTLKTVLSGEYSDLRDDGISVSVYILAAVLLGYVVLVACSHFVLHQWHAYLFYLTYVCYLIYAIGQVYI